MERYGTKKKTALLVAYEIKKFLADRPGEKELAQSLNYEALKPLRRRWQGWCGVLQMQAGRVVCPECGGWDVDNLGDGETAKCLGQRNEYGSPCEHEWVPKWPPPDRRNLENL